MMCEKTVAINKPPETKPDQRLIYFPIQELPVKTATYLLPLDTSPWTSSICGDILRHWKEVGSVLVYDKEKFISVIQEQYRDTTIAEAEKLVAGVIEEGMFREEDGWLIPLKPMLSCATDREVKPDTAWWCYTPAHDTVSISFEARA